MAVQLIASLIVLGLLGLINASYIFWKRNKEKHMDCPLNSDCMAVIESKWSRIFYIKNDTLGIIFYILVLALSVYLLFTESMLLRYSLITITFFAVLFSLFLLYIQARIIKNYCFYCLISSFITLLVFVNTLLVVF